MCEPAYEPEFCDIEDELSDKGIRASSFRIKVFLSGLIQILIKLIQICSSRWCGEQEAADPAVL
jgi:hypothetical protein